MKLKDIFPTIEGGVQIEFRLFEITMMLTVLVFLFWTIFSFALNYNLPVKVIYSTSLVIYSTLFIAQRKGVSFSVLASFYYVLAFIILGIGWLPSGGITGAILCFFVLVFVSGLLVLPLKSYLLFIIATAIMVGSFAFYELRNPEAATYYVNRVLQIRDTSIAGMIMISSLGFGLFVFKRAFLADRVQLNKVINELGLEKIKAESADKAKSQFLATISHEMRTPLNGIVGLSELLGKTRLDHEQQEMLTNLTYSSSMLHSLISDVLDLSAIEEDKLVLGNHEIKIQKEIEGVLEIFKDKLSSNVELVFSHDPKIPEIVYGDVIRFRQVLINLINNAVKFTEQGFIKIKSDFVSEDKHQFRVKISITDSGSGVSEENKENLFIKFFRADTKFKGTGLGLTISKRIIELMGGKIGVNSELGKGSEFFFEVPFDIQLDDRASETISDVNDERLSKLKVLIAEDVKINQLVLSKMLINLSITDIEIVEDGQSAIEKSKENDYDLILMDIQMPRVDGVEAAITIFEDYKSREKKLVIIAVTANVMKSDLERYKGAGIHDVLAKPVKSKMLTEVLDKYI